MLKLAKKKHKKITSSVLWYFKSGSYITLSGHFVINQKSVLPHAQSVTSKCFENKNNNCCEKKMPFIFLNKKMVHKLHKRLKHQRNDSNVCI